MASRFDELSADEIDHIERSRARETGRTARRELLTESAVSGLFVLSALAMAIFLPHDGAGLMTAAWLAVICAVLVRIEFEVGEGRTHPLQLAFVPMLLLLSPGAIPLVVLCAHLAAMIPKVVRQRLPARRLLLSVADSSFSLAPALVIVVAGRPDGVWSAAALCTAAIGALMLSDLAISSLRMRVGLGMDPRAELRGFTWVYLTDLCLAPIGFVAALAGRAHPAVLVAVLPLAGLLAIFARERRGRIENALKLQRLAQEGRDRLQSIVQNSSDLIAILDRDGTVRTLTGSVAPIFGPDWEAAQGEHLLDRVHPQDAALVEAFLDAAAAKAPGEPHDAEWRMRYADGTYRHIAAVATNLLDDPRVSGIVVTASDVNDRKAFEEQLRHRAFHDALTGLANRALFYDRVEHALTRAAREDAQIAVLFADLDDFKAANDARGHGQGDRLLEEVARRLTSCLRSTDTAARLGGDEFGVLIEDVTNPRGVTHTAARILDALTQPVDLDGEAVAVSASIGLAISGADDRGVEELLRKADLAMYEAKRRPGRGLRALAHADVRSARRDRAPRGPAPARAGRPAPARAAALGPAHARARRPLLRRAGRRPGHLGAGDQVAARPRADRAGRGRRGARRRLRRHPRRPRPRPRPRRARQRALAPPPARLRRLPRVPPRPARPAHGPRGAASRRGARQAAGHRGRLVGRRGGAAARPRPSAAPRRRRPPRRRSWRSCAAPPSSAVAPPRSASTCRPPAPTHHAAAHVRQGRGARRRGRPAEGARGAAHRPGPRLRGRGADGDQRRPPRQVEATPAATVSAHEPAGATTAPAGGAPSVAPEEAQTGGTMAPDEGSMPDEAGSTGAAGAPDEPDASSAASAPVTPPRRRPAASSATAGGPRRSPPADRGGASIPARGRYRRAPRWIATRPPSSTRSCSSGAGPDRASTASSRSTRPSAGRPWAAVACCATTTAARRCATRCASRGR